MRPRAIYLALCVLGTVVPYTQLVPWVAANGLDPALLVRELFSTRIGAFFGLDVLLSAVALFAFIGVEGRRLKMRRLWAPALATLLVGVSLGLPLFLYLRERRLSSG